MKYIIGLDLGTTAIKALLFDENAKICGQASREDRLITPRKGWVEQDARQWWTLSVQVIREAVDAAGVSPAAVAGLSVSSQGITVVPVDAAFQPLANAINWLDNRGEAELEAIAALGAQQIYARTGKNIASGGYTLSKLLWIKNHQPDTYARSDYFLLPHDYIVAQLCGVAVTDHSMASATMLYDVTRQDWCEEILDHFDIDFRHLPWLMWAGERAGTLRPAAAAALGLTTETAVFVGGQDQKVAAFGAGLSPTVSTVSIGTCQAYEFLFESPPLHPRQALPSFSYLQKGKWTLEGCTNTAGAAIKWARENIFAGLAYDDMNRLAEAAPLGANGVVFYPYLSGSGSPHAVNGDGVFSGLTLDVGRGDLARAIYEGLAYEARANLEAAGEAGVRSDKLVVFGGGSKSAPLCQTLADVCGRELVSFDCPEMGAMGAAKLCATALDCSRFTEGSRQGSRLWQPEARRHDAYTQLYQQYREKMAAVEKL